MGASYVDYIVADPTLIPEAQRRYYSEKILYLPNSYQPNDDAKRDISERRWLRSECGLPDTGTVYCGFNSAYKITPDLFRAWLRILKAVDGSVLWLSVPDPIAARNLQHEASAAGVDAERLVFAARCPSSAEHLARHRLADLFLDTMPYNAHTTASDALWAGLPVLTLAGDTFASRVAASLLNTVGLSELITHSLDEYETAAAALATDRARLAAIKEKLDRNRTSTPLFDTHSHPASRTGLRDHPRPASRRPAAGAYCGPRLSLARSNVELSNTRGAMPPRRPEAGFAASDCTLAACRLHCND